jgi:UDP-glucuronate 4-epimerase
VHLAAHAGVRPSLEKASLYNQVNVAGTLSLLEMAKARQVKQFVFASSSSVYGNAERASKEDDLLHPLSPYAATKAAGEAFCHSYGATWAIPSVTCLRFFTVYGPRQRPEMAITQFAERITNKQPIVLRGGCSSSRDYTFVEDTVGAIVASLSIALPGFEIFNIGSGNPQSLTDMVTGLEHVLDCKAASVCSIPRDPSEPFTTHADIAKAKSLLQWSPTISFAEGLRRTYAHICA